LRRAPEGAALWTPAGVITPDPEMLRISPRLRAGRGLWRVSARFALLTDPPKGLRAGRLHAFIFYGYQK